MKLWVLRHEERDIENPLFFSELTKKGKEKSHKLIDSLDELEIDVIYCSPFLRVIQTIYPYCINNNKLVNIDNSLYESMDNLLFNETNSNYTWKDLSKEYHNIINKEYKSICDNVKLYEVFKDVCDRINPFVKNLIKTDKNILIVSHLTVCNAILNFFDKTIDNNFKIEMGKYKEINI